MKNFRPIRCILGAIALVTILTACGGGSGSSKNPHPSSQVDSSSSSFSSISSISISSSTSSSSAITAVTIRYKRQFEDYTGWGLHLWGNAIAPATATQWNSARSFDEIADGWAVAVVPVTNPAMAFNLIAHKGDIKSSAADLSFIPNMSGAAVWIVQNNNNLFFNEADALAAAALIGNASATLDLSYVPQVTAGSALPDGWNRSANFMEIFVRSYQDSDGDGHGDLQGLISRLDYLQALGITGIWLMPVKESSDNDHGYSVIDYRKIESDYGTMEDFENLLAEAHERGIGVIIDYVINHSSYANPLFMDASSGIDNDKRDWYVFLNTNPGWTSWTEPSWHEAGASFYYGVFNAGLPDFNLANPDVVNYHADNLRFWLNKGVDGFRFDATGLLFENGPNAWIDQPENHPLLAELQAVINSYDNRYMICESTDSPTEYAVPSSCINVFAFGYQWDVKNTAKNHSLVPNLANLLKSSTKENMPLILSNHDSFAGNRPIRELSGNNLGDYKVAAAITTLVSSTPFAYYGEEIGMANRSDTHDGKLRTPMSWTSNTTHAGFSTVTPYRGLSTNVVARNVAAQDGVNGSLLEYYRMLYTVRKNNPVLGTGTLSFKSSGSDTHVIFTRTEGANVAAVLINLSLSAQDLSVDTGINNEDFMQQFPATDMVMTSDGSGMIVTSVPPQGVVVFKGVVVFVR